MILKLKSAILMECLNRDEFLGMPIFGNFQKSRIVPKAYEILMEYGFEFKSQLKYEDLFDSLILRKIFKSAWFKVIRILRHNLMN